MDLETDGGSIIPRIEQREATTIRSLSASSALMSPQMNKADTGSNEKN
jgi:hypothetical protein